MFRGTTPTLTFKVNDSVILSNMTQIWVTLKEEESKKEITFDINHLTINDEEHKIIVTLTQQQTLSLKPSCNLRSQIRLLDNNNKAYCSNEVRLKVNNILKEGVISNE